MTRFARYKKTYIESEGFKSTPLNSDRNSDKQSNKEKKNKKEEKSELRREKRQKERESRKVCFKCRKPGHSVKNCKENVNDGDCLNNNKYNGDHEIATGICYHCGTTEHTSKNCNHINKKKSPFKFAECFICKEEGHLASMCKKNNKGLYPNGGSCKFCESVEHLAKDCNMVNKKAKDMIELGKIDLEQGADDDDVFLDLYKKDQQKRQLQTSKPIIKKKAKVVKF